MFKTRVSCAALTVVLGASIPFSAMAQEKGDNNLARFTLLKMKPDLGSQFDDGYARHLEWHAENGDPWNWYGWKISSGVRDGVFVDATFGRSWSDLDDPVDPSGDGADGKINVAPFVDFYDGYSAIYEPDYSRSKQRDLEAKYQSVTYLSLHPGTETEFETFLEGFAEGINSISAKQAYRWYRHEDGKNLPQYFLMLPHDSYADYQTTENIFARIFETNEGARQAFRESVKSMRAESMTYSAKLTYIP